MDAHREQLPNSTLILVFGILSIVGCCCYGIVGLIFGIIAVVMARKATDIYNADPGRYIGYQNVKAGKIMGIIGICLSVLAIILNIIAFAFIGMDGIEEMQRELMEQYGG